MEKTVYLTAEGRERFAAELHELITKRRPEVEGRLRDAKEFSDTVDNADYEEAKAEQSFVEGRIRELQHLLASAQIIEEPKKADYVKLGGRVTVLDDSGERETYHLVGSQEADPRKGAISNESPIGRAILGKRAGDEVTVVAPAGSFKLRIEAIE